MQRAAFHPSHGPSRRLVQLCLAWFMLALLSGVASAVVRPGVTQMVCSAGPMKWVQLDADGEAAPRTATLDCPLCATPMSAAPASALPTWGLPPAAAATPVAPRLALPQPAPHWLPPSRGPPALA